MAIDRSKFISNDEHFAIARELEKHHAIFERIWTMSRIRFTKKVPTAGVLFNKKGDCIDFIVNKEFWDAQSFEQKCFVLAHECMHIALNHGRRARELFKTQAGRMVSNFAQDLVINHALVNRYGFVRDVIDPSTPEEPLGKYCWKDKLLPDRDDLTEEENYEVYYNELMKQVQENMEKLKEMLENAELVDDHDFNQGQGEGIPMPGDGEGDGDGKGDKGEEESEGDGDGDGDPDDYDFIDWDDYTDDFSDAIDKLDEELSGDEKETLQNFIEENEGSDQEIEGEGKQGNSGGPQQPGPNKAGTEAGGKWTFAKTPPPKPRKFESIVTDWAKKRMTETEKETDQWVFTNRRFSLMGNTGFLLPTEYEVMDEFEEEDLIVAWFFQDTSGSCAGYKDRFFAIAESMPQDRFAMELFCFDTKIYPTTLESKKLYGFGGTYFHIIEEYIQQRIAQEPKVKYPDAVFVVTDGYGTDVIPEKPDRWHWILTPSASTGNFPATCNTYDLAKYE